MEAAIRRQGTWSLDHELASRQIEYADFWGRTLAQILGAKPSKLPKPPQIAHPDRVRPRPKVTSDPAEIRKFFSQHLKGGGST